MKKIGFVTPWFGENIPGGAEMELRGLTTHLSESGLPVEILTTCAKEFLSDWSKNAYAEGLYQECGMPVRRFSVGKRDTALFDAVNWKLMNNQSITQDEERIYVDNMINSPNLYKYMKQHEAEYSLFVFIPYMFGTTYFGCAVCPEKSVLIPCLHDESYAYMNLFKERFSNVAGMIFHAQPESDLAHRIYNMNDVENAVLGEGIYTDMHYDKDKFREKYAITEPFILYMGRKDTGKQVDVLVSYFHHYKERNKNDLKLVLLGGGQMCIPATIASDVVDLGFVPLQDKYDAAAASAFLCQPSQNESFSLVIMESWLCERPVLVNASCAVTKNFAIQSNAGLYYQNFLEFEACTNYFLSQDATARDMGIKGRDYVLSNFTWEHITDKYTRFFEKVSEAKI